MIASRLAITLRRAERFRADGAAELALADYAAVLDENPSCTPALIASACLHIQAGDPAAAQPLLLRACGVTPGDWQAWDALGIALAMSGDAAAAETALYRALDLAPEPLPIVPRFVAAVLAAGHERGEAARQDFRAEAAPLDPLPPLIAGLLLAHLGEFAEALDRLETAALLVPHSAPIARAVAEALIRAGQPRAAVTALKRAVALEPHDLGLRNNLGAMLTRVHKFGEAETVLRGVLADGGPRADALSNLANALCSLGRQAEGVAAARAAVAVAPELALPRRTLTTALSYTPGVSGRALLDAARASAANFSRPATPPVFAARAPGPLRVGLLPATLRTHPVAWLTIAAFEALDPARIHLVVLAPDELDDPMRRRFRAAAGTWVPVRPATDAAFAEAARAQSLDVLIDLGGGGEGGHLGTCAARVAPTQIKWVGAQGHSTGLPEMDFFLTDRWETPEALAGLYTERLLTMPDGYCCYSPPAHAPAVAPPPALANGFATFGCLNNLAKVTPPVIALWTNILRDIPTARLLIQAQALDEPGTTDALRQRFAGVSDRVDLVGSLSHRAMLARYATIDIALDPFPYSGGLTTCEALWMGVPTLTMPDESFASRHALSHMSNVGLGDWAVADEAAYRAEASARVEDLSALARLRAGLRARVRNSPLCDAESFAKTLTEMLERAARSAVVGDQRVHRHVEPRAPA